MNSRNRITILLLQAAPYLLFLAILLVFGSLSDRFLSLANFTNIATVGSASDSFTDDGLIAASLSRRAT